MLDHGVHVRSLIDAANEFVDGATFSDASDAQVLALADVFERRAGRPLADLEINALFSLAHKLSGSRCFIEGILCGKIKVVGQRADGAFVYSA